MEIDPMFLAYSYFRRKKFEKCSEICGMILEKSPYDQAAWILKTKALTEQVYVDEAEMDEEGIMEQLMDDNAIAQVARPGTSLKQASQNSGQGAPSQGVRPMSQAGRPVSGFARPGTQSGRPGTMEQALKAPRTAHTARPVTSASGRFVRLGTALDLAAHATEASQFKDWWWKVQLGKCYYRLGMYRDAEKQFLSAQKQQEMVDTYLYLSKVYQKLDQPVTAIDHFKRGLERYPNNMSLLTGCARIYELLNDMNNAVKYYTEVLHQDNMNIEAISCIGTHYFYTDRPEVALKFFRRLVQMGVYNAELYNNLGLCCFYAQQYDMTLTCFERALSLATDESLADVWYNIGHVCLAIGDLKMAYQAMRLAIAANNDHPEAYNNLGVLEMRKGNVEQARAFFQASSGIAPHMFEPHFNFALLAESTGDLQTSFNAVKRSHDAFEKHADSATLLQNLRDKFSAL